MADNLRLDVDYSNNFDTPSKVLFLHLYNSDEEMVRDAMIFLSKLGDIKHALAAPQTKGLFVEFESLSDAVRIYTHLLENPLIVRGSFIRVSYTRRNKLFVDVNAVLYTKTGEKFSARRLQKAKKPMTAGDNNNSRRGNKNGNSSGQVSPPSPADCKSPSRTFYPLQIFLLGLWNLVSTFCCCLFCLQ
jgi:hypothetical protein